MKSIYLSAGHSETDPGAVTRQFVGTGVDGKPITVLRREADIVVGFRNIVSFYLTRDGIPHEMDGTGTENMPLSKAVKRARHHPIAVEFHCNAFGNPAATGVETLSKDDDLPLGEAMCEALSRELRITNRGAKGESSGQHHRLAFVQAGGIIVELFFLSNPYDLANYDARSWLAARAVARVLAAEAKSKSPKGVAA